MKRTRLGRHGLIEESAGDPLDGLVNLFDVGVILAVAFLIAGLGLTLKATGGLEKRAAATSHGRVPCLTPPARRPRAATASRSVASTACRTAASSTSKAGLGQSPSAGSFRAT